MDSDKINRLWHEAGVRVKRAAGLHGPTETCGCCAKSDPCDYLCDIVIPYDDLPESSRKNGIAFMDLLQERLKNVKERLGDAEFIDLSTEVNEKVIRGNRDGSHGPKENCQVCFAIFPDVCPKLYPFMGVKFENLDPEVQQVAIFEIQILRRIIKR